MTSTVLFRRLGPIVSLMAVVLTGCAGDPPTVPAVERSVDAPTTTAAEPVADPPDEGSVVHDETADGSPVASDGSPDPAGIVAAMVLAMSGGDLDGAVRAGVVTEAEAEAAVAALESGDLERVLGG